MSPANLFIVDYLVTKVWCPDRAISPFGSFVVSQFRCFTDSLFRTANSLFSRFLVSQSCCFASPFRSFASPFRFFAVSLFSTFVVPHYRSLALSLFRTFLVSQFRIFAVSYFHCFALLFFCTYLMPQVTYLTFSSLFTSFYIIILHNIIIVNLADAT